MASAAVGDAGPAPDLDGVGVAAARVDALIGLAADAVGLGDAVAAHRLLEAAGVAAQTVPSWRPRARLGWVRAELALVEGRPDAAIAPAAEALTAATWGGSARHVLKSRIVLTVARAAAGELPAATAVSDLDHARAECARHGLLPLAWPAALAAVDLGAVAGARGPGAGNDAPAGPAEGALADRASDANRRRHAAARALGDLYSRADPVGKRQMGESRWLPDQSTLV
jgi:hypothetical protein